MIALLLHKLALTALLALALLALLDAADPPAPPLPLVQADFPVCATVHNAPLLAPPTPQGMRAPHVHSDGGTV